MSEPAAELPDDFQRWPDEPRELFGLGENATTRDLKRAYTRLIKRFKPEHAPEQFSRIRAAYEQLETQIEWQERYRQMTNADQEADSTTTENELREPVHSEADSHPLELQFSSEVTFQFTEAQEPGRRPPAIPDDDQLWRQWIDGTEPATVYAGLVELAARRPLPETGYLRLYWLLMLAPELDPSRVPLAWLTEGMRHHGLRSRFLPIFDTELRRHHGLLKEALADELLDLRQPADQLVQLAESRWYAARCLNRFDVIGADLERMKQRMFDEPDAWLRMLRAATQQLVLATGGYAVLKLVKRELEGIPATIDASYVWDSLQSMLDTQNSWNDSHTGVVNGQPIDSLGMLRKLAVNTWVANHNIARRELSRVCHWFASDWSDAFDELKLLSEYLRPLVRRFYDLLMEHRYHYEEDQWYVAAEGTQQEIRRFVRSLCHSAPFAPQLSVMEFCQDEGINLRDVLLEIELLGTSVEGVNQIAERLQADALPLLCLIEAHRFLHRGRGQSLWNEQHEPTASSPSGPR